MPHKLRPPRHRGYARPTAPIGRGPWAGSSASRQQGARRYSGMALAVAETVVQAEIRIVRRSWPGLSLVADCFTPEIWNRGCSDAEERTAECAGALRLPAAGPGPG